MIQQFWYGFLLVIYSLNLEAKTYQPYPHDESPLKAYPELYTEYKKLHKSLANQFAAFDESKIKRKIAILESTLEKKPRWKDGYWLLARDFTTYANTLTDPKEEEKARTYFSKAVNTTQKCLRIFPKHTMCHFFAGVAKGQLGTLNGILASLRKAEAIHEHFVFVYNSPYDYRDGPESLQSMTRIALGMYNRVVPDSILLYWAFGIRGNKKRAVELHREALTLDPPNPCSLVFVGVAEICYGTDADEPSYVSMGNSNLQKALTAPVLNPMMNNCIADAKRLLREPDDACGYTPMRTEKITKEDIDAIAH